VSLSVCWVFGEFGFLVGFCWFVSWLSGLLGGWLAGEGG